MEAPLAESSRASAADIPSVDRLLNRPRARSAVGALMGART